MGTRQNRSSGYQHLFVEISYSHDMMESFCNDDSISSRLNPFQYDERVAELEEELKKECCRVVDTALTERQRDVIRLCADGYTQMEIAKKLDVNQSSITKSIHGNVDYKKGRRIYGGSEKKIKKIVETDPKIKEILKELSELREKKW